MGASANEHKEGRVGGVGGWGEGGEERGWGEGGGVRDIILQICLRAY